MKPKLECPIMTTLAMISDKWKVLILCKLRSGTLRFNELMRQLKGVSQRVLTQQLRELEYDGLVERKVYAEVPPRVEYSLTALGRSLVPVLDQLENWARDNSSQILGARAQQVEKVAGGGSTASGGSTAGKAQSVPVKSTDKL